MVGHVAPEATARGPIAAVRDGDMVVIDTEGRKLELEVTPDEMARRLAEYRPPAARFKTGVFAKYAALVSSASEGAVLKVPER